MRLALVLAALVVTIAPAIAQPAWSDAPTAIAATVASFSPAAEACGGPRPMRLAIVVSRDHRGATIASMPMPGVGGRGLTPLERCLGRAVAAATPPSLPVGLEQLTFVHTLGAAPPSDPAVDDWRDPLGVVTAAMTPRRAELAACGGPRAARVVIDRRRGATRAWLPAWPFHARDGSGTTPAAQRRAKACLTRIVRGWRLPLLPRDLGELHVLLRP